MLARAVQTFANDLHQISDAIKGRTVTQIKGTLQKKAFDEAGIVIQQQVQVSQQDLNLAKQKYEILTGHKNLL